MTELQNLLIAQHRFNMKPTAEYWNDLVQAMHAYQDARNAQAGTPAGLYSA